MSTEIDVRDTSERPRDVAKQTATREQLAELVKFLEGLDRWQEVSDDFKIAMVDHMDYASRCRLALCSKAEHELLRDIPIRKVHRIEIRSDLQKLRTVVVVFSAGPEKRANLKRQFADEETIEDIAKFVEKWMKMCKYQVEELYVALNEWPMATSSIVRLPNCRRVHFKHYFLSPETLAWWIRKLPKDMHRIRFEAPVNETVMTAAQVMRCHEISVERAGEITDRLFLSLKCRRMQFQSISERNFTADGINAFITRWTNGGGVVDFEEVCIYGDFRTRDVLRGLEVETWNHDVVKREAPDFYAEFCRRFYYEGSQFYCIRSRTNPFESLTVLSPDWGPVKIYRTGREGKKPNGESFTYYVVPESF